MVAEIDTAKLRMASVVARLTEAQIPYHEHVERRHDDLGFPTGVADRRVTVLEAARRLGAIDLRLELLTRRKQ